MSTQRLLSSSRFHTFIPRFPPSVLNSLSLSQATTPSFSLKSPSALATGLITSYFRKGLAQEARVLFDEMPERDVVTWTAMITGYTSCNQHKRALLMLIDMIREDGVRPNAYTLSSALKACKNLRAITCGGLVQGLALKIGYCGDVYVDNALLDLYATCCDDMDYANVVFEQLYEKNAVSWTTLISGYTHRGDGYGGLHVFRKMLLQEEAEVNPFSFSIAVRACACIGEHEVGKHMHAAIVRHGFESNLPVMNAILDMYCRCGCFIEANQCFHEMDVKDVTTWNTIIAGYERIDSSEALYIFSKMNSEGFCPNCFTFSSVMAVCANLAVFRCGQQIHGMIVQRGLDQNVPLANALIDMYAKCGSIVDSSRIFSGIDSKDVVSWTSMIIGYGVHGKGMEAVTLFEEMVRSGIRPDRVVFIAVLGACSHAGLIDEGLKCFNRMSEYNVMPNQEIYGCAVDLLGRAGRVQEAYDLMESMPFDPDESVWGALLGAIKVHKILDLGKKVAHRVLDLKPKKAGTYVMLANILAAEGRWKEYSQIQVLLARDMNKKEAGRSWLEVDGNVCSFFVRDGMAAGIENVYISLGTLVQNMKDAGYVPDINCWEHDLENGS